MPQCLPHRCLYGLPVLATATDAPAHASCFFLLPTSPGRSCPPTPTLSPPMPSRRRRRTRVRPAAPMPRRAASPLQRMPPWRRCAAELACRSCGQGPLAQLHPTHLSPGAPLACPPQRCWCWRTLRTPRARSSRPSPRWPRRCATVRGTAGAGPPLWRRCPCDCSWWQPGGTCLAAAPWQAALMLSAWRHMPGGTCLAAAPLQAALLCTATACRHRLWVRGGPQAVGGVQERLQEPLCRHAQGGGERAAAVRGAAGWAVRRAAGGLGVMWHGFGAWAGRAAKQTGEPWQSLL